MNPDRLPPHSTEAEQGVLGCILLSPNECLGQCIEALAGGSASFYDLRHQTIYENCVAMSEKGSPIDLISLQQFLKDKGLLDQIGGIAYLNQLQDEVPSSSNISYYLDIVQEKYLLRKVLTTCTNSIQKLYEYDGEVDKFLDEVEREVLEIRINRSKSTDIKALVNEAIGKMEERFSKGGAICGLSTGLADLDKLSDGMHSGEMIVIAGFPSTGKTALAVGIAVQNALQGIPSAVFTAEMLPVSLIVRALCAEAKANGKHLVESDIISLTRASGSLSKAPLYIESANGMTAGQVMAAARRLKQKHNIQMAVVDYIQLLTGIGDNREQQVSSISKTMKAMALELNCTVLALSQLTDDGKLRESRAIGQDADSIWKLENEGEWQPKIQPIKLNIEKCRDGETGRVSLTFLKQYTKFVNASKISDEDVPQ